MGGEEERREELNHKERVVEATEQSSRIIGVLKALDFIHFPRPFPSSLQSLPKVGVKKKKIEGAKKKDVAGFDSCVLHHDQHELFKYHALQDVHGFFPQYFFFDVVVLLGVT